MEGIIHRERIEPETETHRTEKALKTLISTAHLPLSHGVVGIVVNKGLSGTPGGQHLILLLVHLLARMKGLVNRIIVRGLEDCSILPGIPLTGSGLKEGLSRLVRGLSGPKSQYTCDLLFNDTARDTDVRLRIGFGKADLCLGADAWRALAGQFVQQAQWGECCPIGPYMAATIGATEAFKRLLYINFGWNDGVMITNLAFSLFDYGLKDNATRGPDVAQLRLQNLAVAGCGAGGTAALYTLASFPEVSGEVDAVEPGYLKASSLGRYLMSNYTQVHAPAHKLESVEQFLASYASKVCVRGEAKFWHDVRKDWGIVLATVDNPESRWDIQRSGPRVILDAGVMGTLYAVLRVIPGGWCLECKHPPDPEVTWKRRALRWGLSVGEIKQRFMDGTSISRADIERLAVVQGQPVEHFLSLEGLRFDEVPPLTECGQTPLTLAVPSQAPVLPLATTAAGIVLAAEVIKDLNGLGQQLRNYLTHDLRFQLRENSQRFKPRIPNCQGCASE